MVFTCVADDVRLKRSINVSDTQLLYNTTNKFVNILYSSISIQKVIKINYF